MKKQLFIGFLAAALMVTSVPMTIFAAAESSDTKTTSAVSLVGATAKSSSTSGAAVTATDSAINTTDTAINTTDAAITGDDGDSPEVNSETKAPDVLAPISLTLEGAYKKMSEDSPQAILAKYNLANASSFAKGQSEKISRLNRDEKASASDPNSLGVDTSNKASLKASRAFANEQAPKNYESTMNDLKSQTYEMYYNYKYTEAQVQVAKDNLTRVQAVYDSTMLQFKVGKLSKLDTLTAENSLNEAKNSYQTAVNGFEQIKMNFNMFMGYNIHQPVTLTDSLTALPLPEKNLEDAVKEALLNRNEIAGAKYRADMAQLALYNVRDYPSSSATYRDAKIAVDMAQENLKTAPSQIEIDVRTKYMDMKQKYDAVNSGKVSYENSKETARLGQLQFDNGVITITQLSAINLDAFTTQQAYFKAILDYNMAVTAYELCYGIGIETVTIQ